MKKLFYAVAAFALVLTGCAKEIDTQEKDTFSKVRLHVTVADNMTKVSADNDGRYHWQAGDVISVLNNEGNPFDFATEDGGADVDFGANTFEGTLGKYAMYPSSTGHAAVEDNIAFNLPSSYTWTANSTNMPMLGKISGDKATFKSVGGVLKLVCYNIPSGAVLMEFSATNKQISGEFEIADGTVETPVIATAAKVSSNNIVNFDFTGNYSASKVFYIPLPTGTIDGFTIKFYSDEPAELFSKTAAVNLTVARNQMIIAPDLDCAAIADAVLTNAEILAVISGSYDSKDIPSTSGTWSYELGMKQASKLQIKKSSDGGKLSLPSTFSSNIAQIILEGTGNGGGKEFEGTVYFKNSSSNETITSQAVSGISLGDNITISIPTGYTTGYIQADGVIRIASVTVKFVGGAYTAPTITAADALEIPIASGDTNNAETAVSTSGELDALGLTATVADAAKSWLTATIEGGKLKVSAPKNTTGALREGKVTLRITGASKEVTVSQPNALVPNPTDLAVIAGDAKFTATWTGDANATSYVAYLRTTDGTPTEGTNITASISDDGAGNYSITDYAATNDQEYFIYVKVNGVASNYVAPSEYVQENFTPAEAKGTAENPYLASEAFDVISSYSSGAGPAGDIYVKGYVVDAGTPSSSTQTYYISDDGTETKKFEVYKGNGISGAAITGSNRVNNGDYVIVKGTAVNYKGNTPEFSAGSQIVTHYYLDIDYNEVEWAWDETTAEDFTVSINSTGDYKTFTHSESGMDWATVTVVGNVITITPNDSNSSLVADRVGTVTVHHASDLFDDIVISCTQTKAPAHEISIKTDPARIDLSGTKDTPTEITVVSNYAWTSANTGSGYTISPTSGSAGETVVTITPSADGGATETKLGDVTFTDAVDGVTAITKDIYQAAKSSTLKTKLTTGNILEGSGGGSKQTTGYRSVSFTDDNEFNYSAYAISTYHSKATNTQGYIQLKKYASSTAYYVQLPVFSGNIQSITMTVSGTSSTMSGGGNSSTLYFSSDNSTSSTGVGIASGTGSSSITIDTSSLNLKTGYITSGGGVRIWDIEITYSN